VASTRNNLPINCWHAILIKPRHYWLLIHRWIALSVGFLFVVSGLTGSFLAFYPEIDRLINPDWVISKAPISSDKQPLSDIFQSAQQVYPDKYLHSTFPPKKEDGVFQVWFTSSSSDDSQMWEVLVDPRDAKVLGNRVAMPAIEFSSRNIVNTIYTLHYQLFMGQVGSIIVGIVGIILLASCISGLVIWWPRGKNWKASLLIKQASMKIRLAVDIHRTFGIYSFVLLVVITFSGVFLSLPQYIHPVIDFVSPPIAAKLDLPQPLAQYKTELTADQVIGIAKQQYPNDFISCIWLPTRIGDDGDLWRVSLKQLGLIGLAGAPKDLWISGQDGSITKAIAYSANSLGAKFIAWQLVLHNGTILGLAGRILVFITGLVPLFLYVTGLIWWWRKRRSSNGL
jgi:uncharacterized iron-regulated membrane protein